MTINDTNWSYNEFLAFLMIYAAEANFDLSDEELNYIKTKTGIGNIDAIKQLVNMSPDIEILDAIENYRKIFLNTPEQEQTVRKDLEDFLKGHAKTSQLENAVVHLLNRII